MIWLDDFAHFPRRFATGENDYLDDVADFALTENWGQIAATSIGTWTATSR